MENNELIYEEAMDTAVDAVEVEAGNSKMGTGVAMLIGAGLTIATAAVVGLAKKAWAKHKANKELRLAEADNCAEVTDEQIAEVTM